MGLNGCLQFIRNKYPEILIQDHISKYSHQRVIVDIASYIYKYACIYGLDSIKWIQAYINLLLQFKTNHVHPVIVFDGKPPAEKSGEIDERREKKKQSLEKIAILEKAIQRYFENTCTEEDISLFHFYMQKLEGKGTIVRRLLDDNYNTNNITLSQINAIQAYLEKLKQSVVNITPEHFQMMKYILECLGISYLQAPGEAESYCCFLNKCGYGTAVVSYDTDCIAHGATNIIFSVDANTGVISHLNLEELKESIQLNDIQLKDFGILIGCDYNRKNKILNIGPVSAIKLLNIHDKIENIPNIKFDLEEINNIRKLFSPVYDENVLIEKLYFNKEKCLELAKKYNIPINFISNIEDIENYKKKFQYCEVDNTL
jgi:5'-3' exonuclease